MTRIVLAEKVEKKLKELNGVLSTIVAAKESDLFSRLNSVTSALDDILKEAVEVDEKEIQKIIARYSPNRIAWTIVDEFELAKAILKLLKGEK